MSIWTASTLCWLAQGNRWASICVGVALETNPGVEAQCAFDLDVKLLKGPFQYGCLYHCHLPFLGHIALLPTEVAGFGDVLLKDKSRGWSIQDLSSLRGPHKFSSLSDPNNSPPPEGDPMDSAFPLGDLLQVANTGERVAKLSAWLAELRGWPRILDPSCAPAEMAGK